MRTGIFPILLSLLVQPEENSLNNKSESALVCLQLRWCMVGSSTILIDTCGNSSSGRQQTVAIQGQWKNYKSQLLVPPSWARLITLNQKAILSTRVCTFIFISHLLVLDSGDRIFPPGAIKHRPMFVSESGLLASPISYTWGVFKHNYSFVKDKKLREGERENRHLISTFRGGVKWKDVTIKVLEAVGRDGDLTNTVCVSSPAWLVGTAACQPAGPMQRGGVCWGAGVRKVRAEPMQIRWADLKWMQRRASPASQGHGFSARKRETAGAGDSARQNTKAEIGRDTWWTQMQREKLPSLPLPPHPPTPLFPILHLQLSRTHPWRRQKETLESQRIPVELWPARNMWFFDASRDINRGFKEIFAIKESWHVG